MPVTDFIYDNWGNITEVDRLYDEMQATYLLQTSVSGNVLIDEPIGWGKVTFMHKRDQTMHGFNYEYTGSDMSLEFDCDSGMDAILAEYADKGNDGEVIFRRILGWTGPDIIEFEGRLNLNTLKRSDYTLECQVERKSLHQLINSRLDTKVELDSDQDLDDNDVPIYPYDAIALRGQTLTETYHSSKTVVRDEEFTEVRTDDQHAYILFDFNDPSVNTITEFYGNTLGILGGKNLASAGDFSIFKFAADGTYDIRVAVDFKADLKINPRFLAFGKKVQEATIVLQLIIVNAQNRDNDRYYNLTPTYQFNPNTENVSYPRVTVDKLTEGVQVFEGEFMEVNATLIYRHNANLLKSVNVRVKQYYAKLDITGTSVQEPSLASGRLIKASMDALFLRVTGQQNIVKSKFYSLQGGDQIIDGCGANRLLINGGAIRGAPYTKFPLTTTIKEMLISMNAIDCIGMGYEWNPVEQKEFVRIEPADYFYQDVEIMVLESIFDYQEETAKDLIYNKWVYGYDKFKEEDENAYDEIHARHEYQTPIRTESNEYSQISKYNASGYLIEVTRRTQFAEKPTDSTSYDDDIFIIHVYNPGGEVLIYGPVTDQPFDSVSGVLDPTTTLNMSISPKRMLMAHSRWTMSSLIYKDASQPIKNTFVKQNKEFTTSLNAEYCHNGDEALLPLRADSDILIGALRPDLDGIYSPEWVWFKTRMNMTQVRYIMNALRGLNTDGKNYGYLTYTTDLGVTGKGWIFEISFNRESEEVSFKLLKKKFPS